MQKNYKILSFYKFINLTDLEKKKIEIKRNLIDLKLKGTVIVWYFKWRTKRYKIF